MPSVCAWVQVQYKHTTVTYTLHDRCVSLDNLMYLHTGLAGPPLPMGFALDPQPLGACARIAVAVPADTQQLCAVLTSKPVSVGAARACTAAQHFFILHVLIKVMLTSGHVIEEKVASPQKEQQAVQLLKASPEGGSIVVVHG